jgi:shikimate kinase/3-dehydroquinate synthase
MSHPCRNAARQFLFFYGPPGAGKTTLGRLVSASLRLPFYDLDAEIEMAGGQTIPTLFAAGGEEAFRAREKQILAEVLERDAGVVALGGGALLDTTSRAQVEAAGRIVLLRAEAGILAQRLASASVSRPLLAGSNSNSAEEAHLWELLERRAVHYASFDQQIDTGRLAPAEAAWEAQIRLGAFHLDGMGAGYDVRVIRGGLDCIGDMLCSRGLRGPLALVSDENVARLYADRAMASLQEAGFDAHCVVLAPGEGSKTLGNIERLWEAFLTAGLERGSTVVALGGGVVSDLAGFAAATYLRGVAWAIAPTSLLAMVDASLGGKTGIDLPRGKNLAGAFHAPALVLADPELLSSLPRAELRNGLAETVKHGLIGDLDLFELCEGGWAGIEGNLDMLVRRSMAVKARIVQADPYERGARSALNLGHTLGHAIESASAFRLSHGEAVAIGLALETRLAERIGLAQGGLAGRVESVLRGLGLPVEVPAGIDHGAIMAALQVDKKRAGGKPRFSLPVKVGEVRSGVDVDFKPEWLDDAEGEE